MTDREKLMKLIDELPPHEGQTFEEALADHLIANGVEAATKKQTKEPETNGDDIRAMNDEDLATMLVFERDDWCDWQCPDGSFFDTYEEAIAYTVEWLKQPCSDK